MKKLHDMREGRGQKSGAWTSYTTCHKITCKNYERKECIHGGNERRLRNSILLPTLMYGSDLDMK